MAETGQVGSMLCFSPDFTHPDADERARQIVRQQVAIDLAVRLGTKFCRTLSGQRWRGLTRRDLLAKNLAGDRWHAYTVVRPNEPQRLRDTEANPA